MAAMSNDGLVCSYNIRGHSFMLWAIVDADLRIMQVFNEEETADWYLRHMRAAGNNDASKYPVGVWVMPDTDRVEGFWIDGVRYPVRR